jgi:CrcB protein
MSVGLWVGIALLGGLGAVARDQIELALSHDRGLTVVNALGCLALGAIAGTHGDARILAATGFLGALTSFSGWALERRRDGLAGLAIGLVAVAVTRALF